jgi:hypothetical protein
VEDVAPTENHLSLVVLPAEPQADESAEHCLDEVTEYQSLELMKSLLHIYVRLLPSTASR